MDAMAAELVSSPLRHCPLCTAGSALQPQGDTPAVWGLSYSTGFVRLRAQRLRCPSCRAWFLGCWAYPHGGQSRVVIACHPTACSWFFFRERLHADSFVALHTEYLRFMSTAFLFLRASFSGLVKTVQAMFPGPDLTHHDCFGTLGLRLGLAPSLMYASMHWIGLWRSMSRGCMICFTATLLPILACIAPIRCLLATAA